MSTVRRVFFCTHSPFYLHPFASLRPRTTGRSVPPSTPWVGVRANDAQVFMDYRFNPNMPHPEWYSPVDTTATAKMWAADKRDSTVQTLLDNSWYVGGVVPGGGELGVKLRDPLLFSSLVHMYVQ